MVKRLIAKSLHQTIKMSERKDEVDRAINLLKNDLRNRGGTIDSHMNKIGALSNLCGDCAYLKLITKHNNIIVNCGADMSPVNVYKAISLGEKKRCPNKVLFTEKPE